MAFTTSSAQVIHGEKKQFGNDQKQQTMRYVNPLTLEEAGRLADPNVIRYQDKYYLYLTGGGGLAWSSDNLVQWEYHQISMPEGSRITAPAAVAYKGYVYLTGNDTGLFRSRDPLGPFDFYGDLVDERGRRLESDICDGCGDGGVFDPMLFVDEDERVYLYYAGGSNDGIYGVELDSKNLRKLLDSAKHFFRFETWHIWERYGNRNEFSGVSWIEGPWMTKRNGTYYLQYAAPGTDWKTYGVGVYTSKNPFGPFTYYEESPIFVHKNGLINGTVEGPDGTLWAIYTLLFRNWNRMFERRIGMDPVGFDDEENMIIIGPSETPQWAPGVKEKPWEGNESGSIQLSEDKSYTVSSEASGRNAPYAFDNNTRTWWTPAEDDKEPWLILDLGSAIGSDPIQQYIIDSARILFALPTRLKEESAATRVRKYKIEVSLDGESFQTVVDKTGNRVDNAIEFDEITPVQCKYVKLTITGWPMSAPSGVIEFTVFGKPGSVFPPR